LFALLRLEIISDGILSVLSLNRIEIYQPLPDERDNPG
jgi:hypothetical protein